MKNIIPFNVISLKEKNIAYSTTDFTIKLSNSFHDFIINKSLSNIIYI